MSDKKIFTFDVEVDPITYKLVHEYFMHQTVYIRYMMSEDGRASWVRFQPEPVTKNEANVIERALRRLGAFVVCYENRFSKKLDNVTYY